VCATVVAPITALAFVVLAAVLLGLAFRVGTSEGIGHLGVGVAARSGTFCVFPPRAGISFASGLRVGGFVVRFALGVVDLFAAIVTTVGVGQFGVGSATRSTRRTFSGFLPRAGRSLGAFGLLVGGFGCCALGVVDLFAVVVTSVGVGQFGFGFATLSRTFCGLRPLRAGLRLACRLRVFGLVRFALGVGDRCRRITTEAAYAFLVLSTSYIRTLIFRGGYGNVTVLAIL